MGNTANQNKKAKDQQKKDAAKTNAPVPRDPPPPTTSGKTSGAKVPATAVLHVMEYALQFDDSLEQMRADMRFAFSKKPDVVGFTELDIQERRKVFAETCRNNGYTPVMVEGDCLLAVRNGDPNLAIKNSGAKKVHPGLPGVYGARYVSWVQVRFHTRDVYVHVSHWLNKEGGINDERHVLMSKAVAQQVREHGQGSAVSIFMGDVNNNPSEPRFPNEIFRQGGLITIWQEMGVSPPVSVHTAIDFIGRFKPDTNCWATRQEAWAWQNSDHRPLSGWFTINIDITGDADKDDAIDWGGTGVGGDGTQTAWVDPDFYATGGNIDWSDYRDDTIYQLPQATDVLDIRNG